ncbi:hypothetical protein [Cupriavidus metallidurans]|uniref:hypothetical protein n=1 Tax=Cupriavidus metallidurans TaxID=119219 RepID=UPI0016494E24|nr:hypothetical protein [Cupriavidus metallidurans]
MTNRLLPSKLRTQPRVALGRVFVSLQALKALGAGQSPLTQFLLRHMQGDWGLVTDEDWQRNEQALDTGDFLLSSYALSSGRKLWVHTTATRSATFALLPAESGRVKPWPADRPHAAQ